MKSNRRKLVRRSFMAVVTGASAFALQACGDNESQGNNGAAQNGQPAAASDSGDSS